MFSPQAKKLVKELANEAGLPVKYYLLRLVIRAAKESLTKIPDTDALIERYEDISEGMAELQRSQHQSLSRRRSRMRRLNKWRTYDAQARRIEKIGELLK